ncbi:general substrate transporter [Ilyonectria destructans]|nr:general substrate transporter [Ilyonectria destructans]
MVLEHMKGVGPELAAVLPQDGLPWYKKSHLVRLNFSIICLVLFSSANGYDGSMMNGLQALPEWGHFMGNPTGAYLGFIVAVQSLGATVCFPAIAWCNNYFGRWKTIAFGYVWLALGVVLTAAAHNQVMFILGRLFIGGATACWSATAPILITEIAYPSHRSILTSLYNCGWYVGSLVAAWATYGTRNYGNNWTWRVPCLLQVLIPVFIIPGLLLAPESPRWLFSKDRVEEARAFLIKAHAGGDENSKLVAFELAEIQGTIEMERLAKSSTSYADMVKTKGNRHRLFISITLGVFAQWNGVGIASYYLAPVLATVGITDVTRQTLISGFLQVWNLILAVGGTLCVDRLGRRPLFLTSCVGMLVSYILISALSGSFANTAQTATGLAVVPILFIYYGFYDIAFTPLVVSYVCEIWPYTYRARGLAVSQLSTQAAVFFNIFVNPIALEAIQWKYYCVYVGLLVIITVTVFFTYPETNGHSLEEMVKVFDGKDARVPGEDALNAQMASKRVDMGDAEHFEAQSDEKV